jgi:hypothetical protein
MSILDEAVKYEEKVLGDIEYQAYRWTYIFFRQIYHMFIILKDEVKDLEKANDLYMEACWLGEDMRKAVSDHIKEKGLVVKDLKGIADLIISHYYTFGIPNRIIEKKNDEEMLIGGDYCPNPMFSVSPHDSYIERAAFSQYDGWVGTDNLMNVYLRVTGLQDKYEVVMQRTLCLGFEGCRFLFRKKRKK